VLADLDAVFHGINEIVAIPLLAPATTFLDAPALIAIPHTPSEDRLWGHYKPPELRV